MYSKAGIAYVDYFVPDQEILMEQVIQEIDLSNLPASFNNKKEYHQFVDEILGVKAVRMSITDDSVMLDHLVNRMFQRTELKASDVDVIIFINEPDRIKGENFIQAVKHRHSMENAYFMNISGNFCSNGEIALTMASALLNGNPSIHNVLILGSISISDNKDRLFSSYAVLGDGAALVLLNRQARLKVLDSVILSNGGFYNIKITDDNTLLHFKFTRDCLSKMIAENDLNTQVISDIIIQNANPLLVEHAMESLGLNTNLIRKNFSSIGHLAYLDMFVNLKNFTKGDSSDEKSILTFGMGFSGTYA
ncbi:MAG: hypothetical protein EOO43_19320, partial [Flavobacterium sp.]